MFTVSDAVLLSVGQVTVTVTGTVPGCGGAVQIVERSAGCASVPVGALQRYVTAHPIESVATAVTVDVLPTSTVHGLHSAFTVSVCGGGGGGGGGGGQGQCKSKEADWLATLNLYRHLANLPVVTERTEWSAGDQAHATYTAKEDTVGHTEDPMNASYTAAGAEAAANGNVAGHSSPDQGFAWAIDTWMTGPFHALGILDPRLAESGFGIAHDSAGNVQTGAVLDVIRGRSATVSAASFPVVYPADGTALPLDRYAGNELPDPLAPCAGFSQPSGPPIIVQFGSGTPTPLITDIMLTHDGTALSLCAYDANSYSNPDAASQANARNVLANRSAVVIMPKAPFTAGATYRVDMTVDGVSRSWTFTVNCS
jgi:uncharacterized protein YkwD